MKLPDSLAGLRGIGPQRLATLEAAGITSPLDLLLRLPLRYEDRRSVCSMGDLRAGASCWVRGRVMAVRLMRRGRRSLLEAILADEGGRRLHAQWFNQTFLRHQVARDAELSLFGRVEQHKGGRGLVMRSPRVEAVGDAKIPSTQSGEIVPIYERIGPVTPAVVGNVIRSLVAALPPDLDDPLPATIRERLGVVDLRTALEGVHRPSAALSSDALEALGQRRSPGHLRLIREDLLRFQLDMLLRRRSRTAASAPCGPIVKLDRRVRQALADLLPFELTDAQKRVMREIAQDLASGRPMRRLLQGDVGSGKTIVATLAMVMAVENGFQAAFMAPTELLAEQHGRSLARWLGSRATRLARLSSSVVGDERRAALDRIASGQAGVVVGTHALIQEAVRFHRLGLVVVDEQHRFGVVQRSRLVGKGEDAHMLVMTATPIPRTLALTLYADLDVSVLDHAPPGRVPVETLSISSSARGRIVDRVGAELAQGRQAYVVYPLVEASEHLDDVRAARDMAEEWRRHFPDRRVALLHGQLPRAERDEVMAAFVRGEVAVLVATTVVEVGVDVPNATVIVVEHAERFGLAQLHQLRGRVGRGSAPSTCILVTHGRLSATARARIEALVATTDGFVIADKDLALRGPGELLGTRQSGAPRLQVADLRFDADLLPAIHRLALALVDEGTVPQGWASRAATWGAGAG